MSLRISKMNSANTGWNDEDFSTIEKDLIKSQGIVDENADGSDLVVEENSPQQMSVLVNSGVAYVYITKNGRDWWVRVENSAQEEVSISPNVSGNDRIDALVLRVSVTTEPDGTATNVASLYVVEGTPDPSPTAPSDGDITTALGSDGWLRLADILVENGTGLIENADITDQRTGVNFGVSSAQAMVVYYGNGQNLYGVVHSPVDEDLLPDANGTRDIGANLTRWNDLYLIGDGYIGNDVYVGNDGIFTGDVTASSYNGDGSGLTGIGSTLQSIAGEDILAGAPLRTAIQDGTADLRPVESNTSDNSSYNLTTASTANMIAQSFTTRDNGLTERVYSVSIHKYIVAGGSYSWELKVHEDNAGEPGSALNTVAVSLGGGDTLGGQVVDITLTSPLVLQPNTKYWISMRKTNTSTQSQIIYYQNTNVYADGEKATSTDTGSTWAIQSTEDMYFKINYTDTNGRFYKNKATTQALADATVGIAKGGYSAGDSCLAVPNGIIGGLSGKVSGQVYYLSDTRGSLGTSPGSVSKKIGVGLSTTEIVSLIQF